MIQATAERMPSFDRTRHRLPQAHVHIPRGQGRTQSGLIHAIITITSRDLREAITIREMARQTPVDVPGNIDNRRWRYAATWWMQPRNEAQQQSAWTVPT